MPSDEPTFALTCECGDWLYLFTDLGMICDTCENLIPWEEVPMIRERCEARKHSQRVTLQ